MSDNPRVAIVYDRATTRYGGAELVLAALHDLYPTAPLFTSVYDSQQANWADQFEVKTSFLQSIPFFYKFHRWWAVLMPLAFEALDLGEYDLVISVTSAEAKGVITRADQLHISYLLTPTRYLYSHREQYLQTVPPILRSVVRLIFKYLAWWDQVAASRPDVIIPISNLIKKRTEQLYDRPTLAVIYPPVSELTARAEHVKLPFTKFGLVISRLVDYKQIDLAIKGCQLHGLALVVAGSGPSLSDLKSIAGEQTVFLGEISDGQKKYLLEQSQVLLMPGLEDFGITALDALAMGKPVIVHHQSGVAELVADGKTGLHLTESTSEAVQTALAKLDQISFDDDTIKFVADHSIAAFKKKLSSTIAQQWQLFKKG